MSVGSLGHRICLNSRAASLSGSSISCAAGVFFVGLLGGSPPLPLPFGALVIIAGAAPVAALFAVLLVLFLGRPRFRLLALALLPDGLLVLTPSLSAHL